jgi:hypothetical protein
MENEPLFFFAGRARPFQGPGKTRSAVSTIVRDVHLVKGEKWTICPKSIVGIFWCASGSVLVAASEGGGGSRARYDAGCIRRLGGSMHFRCKRARLGGGGDSRRENAALSRLPESLDRLNSLGVEIRQDFPDDVVIPRCGELVSPLTSQITK